MKQTHTDPWAQLSPEEFTLRTPRLLLRPPNVSDANHTNDARDLWPLVSDSRLTTFLAWDAHQAPEETARMMLALHDAQKTGSGFHWLVFHENVLTGLVSLIDVRWQHRSWTLRRAELAYWVGIPYQGRGYATEAAAAVTRFGFKTLGLHKIRVYHAADNPASGKTINKLGFRPVGVEQEAFQKNGTWHHLCHFELLSTEWALNHNSK